ncbi:hypothetical protein AMJ80_01545 [bacterium SM23_31]|nr:MAG: hypothetical protein AMJ80_01545 [bacterium SM23_31]
MFVPGKPTGNIIITATRFPKDRKRFTGASLKETGINSASCLSRAVNRFWIDPEAKRWVNKKPSGFIKKYSLPGRIFSMLCISRKAAKTAKIIIKGFLFSK